MIRSALAGLSLFAASSPVSARAPIVLAPLKTWNLHYADNSCKLIRPFGDPARPTVLVLQRLAPDSSMSMLVYGGGLRARGDDRDARAAFLPFANQQFERGAVAKVVENKDSAILWSEVGLVPDKEEDARSSSSKERPIVDLAERAARRAEETTRAGQVTALEISEPGGRKVVLQTGPLGRALGMMRECAREQLSYWGLDPATQDKIVRPAQSQGSLARLFKSRDYPASAFATGKQAIISARLIVGADGSVTRCTSLTDFRAPEFEEVVCENLNKARFAPAELADGTKVPTYAVVNVRFEMP
jgi:hypothetical protein